jgi:hypothetical protein
VSYIGLSNSSETLRVPDSVVAVGAGDGGCVVVRAGVGVGDADGGGGEDPSSSSIHPADIKTTAIATMVITLVMCFLFALFIVLAPVVYIRGLLSA